MNILSICGSPGAHSRSTWLAAQARTRLASGRGSVRDIALRDLAPQALLSGDVAAPPLRDAVAAVLEADAVIVATPIYKTAYSGLLKVFLDLLPPDTLRRKVILPLATGGSPAHLLALEYALKPVLAALGARHIVDGVYATDLQLPVHAAQGFAAEDAVVERLDRAVRDLAHLVAALSLRPAPLPSLGRHEHLASLSH
jgi:FMN reductase